MGATKGISCLETLLIRRRLESGGWSFFRSEQASIEATCVAILSLGATPDDGGVSKSQFLAECQLSDGSWPSFLGDAEGTWTTSLALSTLISLNEVSNARERALDWLLRERGKESHWFWRWKFKIADREVRFDPDKYGWPWIPGSASWVIPTAFSVVAIKQFTVCNRFGDVGETNSPGCRYASGSSLRRRRLEFRKQRRLRSAASGPRRGHRNRTIGTAGRGTDAGDSRPVWVGSNRDPPASSRRRVSPGAFSACSCIKSRSSISRPDWRRSSETAARFGTMPLSPPRFWH